MCGLIGIAGDCSGKWKDIFSELLLVDVVRGKHSTGAGFVERFNNKLSAVKRPGHPFELFSTKEYEDAMDVKNSYKAILGHNRFATLGAHTEVNAHPFVFETLVGMHNGTLDKFCIKELHEFEKYGTDSQAIYSHMNKFGLKDTMEIVSGAWALVWFDKLDGTLNFLRNDRRPLHYCYSEDHCTIIWASELPMLQYVLQRNGKKAFAGEFFSVEKDMHYSWQIPQGINEKIGPAVRQKQEGRPFWSASYNHGYGGMGSNRIHHGNMTQKIGNENSNVLTLFEERLKTDKFRPPYKDQYGKVINKKMFDAMVNNGCAFCDTNGQKWGEFVQVLGAYTGKHTAYTCKACFDDAEVFPYTQYAM